MRALQEAYSVLTSASLKPGKAIAVSGQTESGRSNYSHTKERRHLINGKTILRNASDKTAHFSEQVHCPVLDFADRTVVGLHVSSSKRGLGHLAPDSH